MEWLGEVIGLSGIAGVFLAWTKGFVNSFLPSPAWVRLALANQWRERPQRAKDGFRLVLCWLEKDRIGSDTDTVAQAFTGIDGVVLVRSACIVTASGAGDEWRPAMQNSARTVLERWKADLAIVGRVKRSGEVLSLWFVPRMGESTLRRGDVPYKLENVTLGTDFHNDLRAQLTAIAFASVGPVADTEKRNQVLGKGLRDATDKLSRLISGRTVGMGAHRSVLCSLLGLALKTLGESETGTMRLEQAVEAHRNALSEDMRKLAPLGWAATLSGLAGTLVALGSRERNTDRIKEAIETYHSGLKECTRERAPFQWAEMQNNLGNALASLGQRESGTDRLKQALEAYEAALEVYTRQRNSLQWATTQNNLGTVVATGVPPKLIIFNGFLVGAGAQHCQGQIRQRDRFATTMTIPTRNGDFGVTRAGSEWPARRAHSTACPNA